MTNSSKFIYFTGVQVSKTKGDNYEVFFEYEELTIYVSSSDVTRISMEVGEREEVIAIVLAYIEYIYQSTNVPFERIERMKQGVINENLICILSKMVAEEFIQEIKEIKWHQLVEIFESENPIQKINEFK